MSIWRILGCIFIPPLAVYDKGGMKILITLLLWFAGGIPGMIAAFYFCTRPA